MLGEGHNLKYDFLQREVKDSRKYVTIRTEGTFIGKYSILLKLLMMIDKLLVANLMFDVAPKDLYVSSQ